MSGHLFRISRRDVGQTGACSAYTGRSSALSPERSRRHGLIQVRQHRCQQLTVPEVPGSQPRAGQSDHQPVYDGQRTGPADGAATFHLSSVDDRLTTDVEVDEMLVVD